MHTTTATRTIDMTDVLGLADLDFDLSPAPVTDAPQAQGDLIVIPWPNDVAAARRAEDVAAAKPVVRPEIVVRGNGGNEHTLVDPGNAGVTWHAYRDGSQTVGVVVVPDGATACMDHREHGRLAIGPGVFVIRRQREQADEIRLVAD